MVEVNPSRRAFMGAVLAGAMAPAVALQAQEKPKDFQPAKRQPIFDYDALFKEQNDPEKFRAKIKADPKFDPLAGDVEYWNTFNDVSKTKDVDALASLKFIRILKEAKQAAEEERAKLTKLARSLYTDTATTLREINDKQPKELQYPDSPDGVIGARRGLGLSAAKNIRLVKFIDPIIQSKQAFLDALNA